jgi:hypothetical protein
VAYRGALERGATAERLRERLTILQNKSSVNRSKKLRLLKGWVKNAK